MVSSFFQQVYLQNRIIDYFIALLIFIVALVTIMVLKNFLLKILTTIASKKATTIDDGFIDAFKERVKPFMNLLYFAAFYFSFYQLKIPIVIERYFNIIIIALFIFYIVKFTISIFSYFLENYWIKKEKDSARITALRGIETFIKIVLWSIAFIVFLDNLGVQISALLAGLGIGGIAIALASQNILGDLFSYFIIFFDRPFEIGDFLNIDDFSGTIEHIGIKTTRIRGLGGEQIIFSNTNLVNSRLRNFKRMKKRRISFSFVLIHQTSLEQLKEIPDIIKTIFQQISGATLDRAHFSSFANSGLNFEVVYYVNSREYNQYMNIQQEINFRLKEELEKRSIRLAYPTQTVFLSK